MQELVTNATASQARKNTDLASPDYSGAGYNFTLANVTANPNAAAASASASALAAAAINGAGSWNVVGQSGAIAIHAILTPDNHALLMMRPDPTYPDTNLAVGLLTPACCIAAGFQKALLMPEVFACATVHRKMQLQTSKLMIAKPVIIQSRPLQAERLLWKGIMLSAAAFEDDTDDCMMAMEHQCKLDIVASCLLPCK